MKEVYGPYDQEIPAVEFEYYPDELPARAVTRNKIHFDSENEETLDTVLFIDGLKRVIQTQKEGEVLEEGSKQTAYGMLISGKRIYDGFGRLVKEGQPVFRNGYDLTLYPDLKLKNPTENIYDIMDRKVETILPDENNIITEYDIEDGLMKTSVTDPEGKIKHSYQDLRGNIRKLKQFNNGESIITKYNYNPLNEIVAIIDNEGNTSSISYNMLGQGISIDSPDRG